MATFTLSPVHARIERVQGDPVAWRAAAALVEELHNNRRDGAAFEEAAALLGAVLVREFHDQFAEGQGAAIVYNLIKDLSNDTLDAPESLLRSFVTSLERISRARHAQAKSELSEIENPLIDHLFPRTKG